MALICRKCVFKKDITGMIYIGVTQESPVCLSYGSMSNWSKKRGSFIVKNTYINGELNNNFDAAINIKQTGVKIPEETVEEKDISPPMKQ